MSLIVCSTYKLAINSFDYMKSTRYSNPYYAVIPSCEAKLENFSEMPISIV